MWVLFRIAAIALTYNNLIHFLFVQVGFYMVTAFDGGRSIMRRAARVHEEFRGRGVYRRLEEELETYIR